jgi:hypothetical protein
MYHYCTKTMLYFFFVWRQKGLRVPSSEKKTCGTRVTATKSGTSLFNQAVAVVFGPFYSLASFINYLHLNSDWYTHSGLVTS